MPLDYSVLFPVSSQCYGSNLLSTFSNDDGILQAFLDHCDRLDDCFYVNWDNRIGSGALCTGYNFLTSSNAISHLEQEYPKIFLNHRIFPELAGYDRVIDGHEDAVVSCPSSDIIEFATIDIKKLIESCFMDSQCDYLKINLFFHDANVTPFPVVRHYYEKCSYSQRQEVKAERNQSEQETDHRSLSIVYRKQTTNTTSVTKLSLSKPIKRHYQEKSGAIVGDEYFQFAPIYTIWDQRGSNL